MRIHDEFDFIQKIKPQSHIHREIVTGIGDDAAVFSPEHEMNQVICVDTMVEEVHFLKNLSTPFEIGYKALAVNISDIAAMGGFPTYFLVSIAIPPNWNEQELLGIYEGMKELASQFKIDLIGGDTVSSKNQLVLTVTVMGEVEKKKHCLRSDARAGDVVFVTGTIGDSAAGLSILLNKSTASSDEVKLFLTSRHKKPKPQVKAGRVISKLERASLNDISDGLASELNEIAEASTKSITIYEELLPLSPELLSLNSEERFNWALYGGEDFELVGTTSIESFKRLSRQLESELIKITKIGQVTDGPASVHLVRQNETIKLEKSGYNHFKR
ncbi:thiamine-phosphate kinase [Metabacillus herbersteinensis]|uniref:Thiamine-monophosphate kinase n=1 Tax=Metabacillus herbersteinensis TaxID=283816 RepID=A0ABV6GLF1_9BACI